jgi:glycosyltransferase involved in cell wall biosynthesis
MSPVESMAAGKPVIWVNEWGLKETILDNKTGILISDEANVSDLKQAILDLNSEKALSMREACETRAKDFSLESFAEQLTKHIQK